MMAAAALADLDSQLKSYRESVSRVVSCRLTFLGALKFLPLTDQ